MGAVTVLILHRPAGALAGPLERMLAAARAARGERHRAGFLAAGAGRAVVVAEADNDEAFGARLRRLSAGISTPGLVVLGSGAMALARSGDRRDFVEAAAAAVPGALANNRYSADAIAIAGAACLRDLPDLPGDNALPRWLAEVAHVPVGDLRARWRLAVDLDSPGDLLLPGVEPGLFTADLLLFAAADRLAAIRSVMADARAELLVAGRTSAGTLAALERQAACRVRALVEERGLRASSPMAMAPPNGGAASQSPRSPRSQRSPRPPHSLLGALLDRDGPELLAAHLGRACDAAVVDTRVLLAHRLGADERAWPSAEDRFASDLLLADRIADPWLQALTRAAVGAPVPIALGGHTLVGPGLRLVAGRLR